MSARLEVEAGFAEDIFQGFLRGLKLHWRDELYRRVVAKAAALRSSNPVAVQAALRDDIDHALYAWLEHRGQQFKYVSRYGMLPVVERQSKRLSEALAEAEAARPGKLRLDPDLRLPSYYTDSDFHQHPGGIWSDDVDAFTYEWAADVVSFSMASARKPHAWFADYIVGRFGPKRIVALGCGCGKSVLPFKRAAPQAEVIGVDLSAPALRLANRRAFEEGLDVGFLQAAAERTRLPEGSQDAVVCTWLLHELPIASIHAVLREGRRLLRPGGVFASHDMHTAPGDVVGLFLHLGHAARDNEPFLPGLLSVDLRAAFEQTGFGSFELVDSLTGAPGKRAGDPLANSRTHVMSVALGRAR